MPLETGSYINDLVASNPPGTDAKAQGDDHLRLIKNALKNCFAGFTGAVVVTGTDGGAVNAYTLTTTPALIGYTTRMIALFSPTIANTGAATINISGLGTRPIVSVSNVALVAGDLVPGTIYSAAYDGTSFRLLSITKNYADQLAFGASLPAQAGNADKFITTNGAVANWSDLIKVGTMKFADSTDTTKRAQFSLSSVSTGTTRAIVMPDRDVVLGQSVIRSARTSNTILGLSDNGSLIDVTSGTFTQTFTAAISLFSGWYVFYRNSGTGQVTIPSSDGVSNWIMYPGETRLFQCDGANFNSYVINPFSLTMIASGNFIKPPGYVYFDGELCAGGASGGNSGSANSCGGGGGGACVPFKFLSSLFAASVVISIGAGGLGVGAGLAGNDGGNSSIAGLLTAYGGSGGGSAGAAGGTGGGALSNGATGGRPSAAVNRSSDGLGGGQGGNIGQTGGDSAWGGAGAGSGAAGGSSVWGGAGGGGGTAGSSIGGTSIFGGNGGGGRDAVNGVDGTAPSGGGGGTRTGAISGAGARGELRIRGVC